jgi:hypothetical protein
MRRALLLSLACCGYAPLQPISTDDLVDASSSSGSPDVAPRCWQLDSPTDGTHWSGCTSEAAGDAIDLVADTVIDTDNKDSVPAGYACVVVPISVKNNGLTEICALFANSIKIEAGVTLSAHGQRPLALFAHSIDIEGTVDVASYIGGQRGPGSNLAGCNPSAPATKGGGGAGGCPVVVAAAEPA